MEVLGRQAELRNGRRVSHNVYFSLKKDKDGWTSKLHPSMNSRRGTYCLQLFFFRSPEKYACIRRWSVSICFWWYKLA